VSAENVEAARRMRETLLEDGPDAAVEFFHPQVTFDVAVGRFEGHEGMSAWFREITKYLVDYEIAGAEFIDVDGSVVVNNVMRAKGGHTALATQDQIYLLRFRDGKIIGVTRHASKGEALAAAGVEGAA
jgi:hypothetical protein